MPAAENLQITLDGDLAKSLQDDTEVQRLGVSEFARRAIRFYVRYRKEMEIRQQYKRGYGENDLTDLALEMKDWEDEQVWPEP